MTSADIMKKLEALGSESYKRIMLKHQVAEPIFGVSVAELKKFQKQIKMDYRLALDLYDTGNYDAQYLAGLIADDAKMTKKDLANWLAKANSLAICKTTLAWVASESPHGWEMGVEWIDSKKPNAAPAGWATLGNVVAITEDADLDLPALKKLLKRVEQTLPDQADDVRGAMNGFVIGVGVYVTSLTGQAMQVGMKLGKLTIDMGDTACKVPYIPEYIEKSRKRNPDGRKKKTAKC